MKKRERKYFQEKRSAKVWNPISIGLWNLIKKIENAQKWNPENRTAEYYEMEAYINKIKKQKNKV